MERPSIIALYLSTHDLAFRGTSDKVFASECGNFLGLIELLSKYVLVMYQHVRHTLSK
jgi:hypothetical protein